VQDLMTYLATPAGSAIVGALLVTAIVKGAKKLFGWLPGDDAALKQLTAAAAALLAALAAASLAGTLTVGVVAVKLLEMLGGATLLHAYVPGLRSEESKAPGTPAA
jgi:TRAP-type C4-dicarboxylate transport system permease large subunit